MQTLIVPRPHTPNRMPGGTPQKPRPPKITTSLPLATLTLTILLLLLAGTATATTSDDQNPTTPTIANNNDATTTPWTTLTNHPHHPTDDAINTPNQALEPEDDDACTPHPPIRITQDQGPRGFILGHHPTTGDPIYRPGSGVTAGTGTIDDPYVIEGWCIDEVRTWLLFRDSGIVLAETTKHVVVQDTVLQDLDGVGVLVSTASNITVKDTTIQGNVDGFQIRRSHNVTVTNNTIQDHTNLFTDNGMGVWVFQGSTNITIQDNTITNNQEQGIYLSSSATQNRIRNNTITNNGGHGVEVFWSPRNVIENNAVHENGWEGIRVSGDENVIKGNTVLNHTAFAPDGISVWDSSNVTVENNLVENTRSVHLSRVDNILVENNTITNSTHSGWGLSLFRSEAGLIQNNTVEHSNGTGIQIIRLNNATIANNTATNNQDEGFHVRTSKNVTVEHNTAKNNHAQGLALVGGTHIHIANNTIQDNADAGLLIGDWIFVSLHEPGHDYHVTHNHIQNNGHNPTEAGNGTGILVQGGHALTIHQNNIHDNHDGGVKAIDPRETVDARHNWWGCPDGPDDAACDSIQGNVAYDSWLTTPNPLAGAEDAT